MTLTTKFKKDISTLRAAANKEIFLDVKYPKSVSYTHLTLPTTPYV